MIISILLLLQLCVGTAVSLVTVVAVAVHGGWKTCPDGIIIIIITVASTTLKNRVVPLFPYLGVNGVVCILNFRLFNRFSMYSNCFAGVEAAAAAALAKAAAGFGKDTQSTSNKRAIWRWQVCSFGKPFRCFRC